MTYQGPVSLEKWLTLEDCSICGNRRHVPKEQDEIQIWAACECLKGMRMVESLRAVGVGLDCISATWQEYLSDTTLDTPVTVRAKKYFKELMDLVSNGKYPKKIPVIKDDLLKKGVLVGSFLIRAAVENKHSAKIIWMSQVKEDYFKNDSIKSLLYQNYLCIVLGDDFKGNSDFVGNLLCRIFRERRSNGKFTFFVSRYPLEELEFHYGPDVQGLFLDPSIELIPVG